MTQTANSQTKSQNVTETSYLIDEDSLSKKQQRMRDAVMLYYGNNEFHTEAEVAEELGVSRETVSRYLNSDDAKGFKKIFSHRSQEELERWLEDMAARHFNKAVQGLNTALTRAREHDDVSPQVLTNASLGLLKADEKFTKNLQEMGVIQKPKERKEHEHKDSGPTELNINFEQVDSEEEVEVEDEQD